MNGRHDMEGRSGTKPEIEQFVAYQNELQVVEGRLAKALAHQESFRPKVFRKVTAEYEAQIQALRSHLNNIGSRLQALAGDLQERLSATIPIYEKFEETREELELRHLTGEITTEEFELRESELEANAPGELSNVEQWRAELQVLEHVLSGGGLDGGEAPPLDESVADEFLQTAESDELADDLEDGLLGEEDHDFADGTEVDAPEEPAGGVIAALAGEMEDIEEFFEEETDRAAAPAAEGAGAEDEVYQDVLDEMSQFADDELMDEDVEIPDDLLMDDEEVLLEEDDEFFDDTESDYLSDADLLDPIEAESDYAIPGEGGSGEATLVIQLGQPDERRYYLSNGGISVGRGPDNDIQLATDTAVSRNHSRIYEEAGEYWISDLNSSNGTLVNGQRITTTVLSDEDEISIGQTLLKFMFE